MKLRTKLFLVLAVLLLSVLSVVLPQSMATPATAAPLATSAGPEPLYDSGWVLTTSGFQNFDHDLVAFPTDWQLMVADSDVGQDRTGAAPRHIKPNGQQYGYLVSDVMCNDFEVMWMAAGIGYSHRADKWYQAGTDYARLLIYASDYDPEGPPCR